MGIQTELGKAFEYACLQSFYKALSNNQDVVIEQNRALNIAKEKYKNASSVMQSKMNSGADAATRVILRLEPQLTTPQNNIPLYIAIQEDSQGITGDVRDIICFRRQNNWQIGLSCKHNHSAVKHSRLSDKINFGESWFNISCTKEYFDEIIPIFKELRKFKKNNMLWRNIKDKEQRFYIPVLEAFMNELRRLDSLHSGEIPKRLLHYLLGKNDFYKIISHDRKRVTQIQAFNINNTLNRSSGNVHPLINIQQLIMPTRIIDISFKPNSSNTIIVTCDNGWTVSMRIHNASSKVEPSLKFDVQLTGVPPTLYTHYEPWDK